MPNELLEAVFVVGVACGVLLPWSLIGISKSWRRLLFQHPTLWSKRVVQDHVKNMLDLWAVRGEPSPPGLARALRAYLLASLGKCVRQADLDWLVRQMSLVETYLCWSEPMRDAGKEGALWHELPYHPLSQAAYLASLQDLLLVQVLATPGPLSHRHRAILRANLVLGDVVRMLSRTAATPSCTAVQVAQRWWRSGRCPSARLWLFIFDLDPSTMLLDYDALLINLDVCATPGDGWHSDCYLPVMAMTAEHIIRGTEAQNEEISFALLRCLRLASQPNLHPTPLAAATYRWQALRNAFALARVLVYSRASTIAKLRVVVPLLGALPSSRRIAHHSYKTFHEIVRRLACAVINTELSQHMGQAVFEQTDILRANKLGLCLLALAHNSPCSKHDSQPRWATNYEAALALSGAVIQAPHAVCAHVLDQVSQVWEHAESACAGGEDHPDAVAFCHGAVGMGYMSPTWAWKSEDRTLASQELDLREHSRYPGKLWSPTSEAWHASVSEAISQTIRETRIELPQPTRRTFLLYILARARAAVSEPRGPDRVCFFETCEPQELGGGWTCCDGAPVIEIL